MCCEPPTGGIISYLVVSCTDCTEIVAAGMAVGTFLLPGLHAASMVFFFCPQNTMSRIYFLFVELLFSTLLCRRMRT